MTDTPTLTGQDIGTAARATGALLDRVLSNTGIDFQGSIVLNALATNSSALGRDQLVARVVSGLKVDATSVAGTLTGLLHSGLVSEVDGTVSLTSAGTTLRDGIRERIGEITQRIYGGLPADELAVAHRVLVAVTERANAELAA